MPQCQTRRAFLRSMTLAATSVSVLGPVTAGRAQNQTHKARGRHPNVLLIMTDDQGWGDIRSHGNEAIDTPVCDKLAQEGARFERFFSSGSSSVRSAPRRGPACSRDGIICVRARTA